MNHVKMEEVRKNPKFFAQLFAEGHQELEKLILNLWERNIGTYQCCAGHEEGDCPYIMLHFSFNQKEIIYALVSSIYNFKNIRIMFEKKHNCNEVALLIGAYGTNTFFRDINQAIERKTNIDDKVEKFVDIIVDEFLKVKGKNYDLYCERIYDGNTSNVNIYAHRYENGVRHLFEFNTSIDEEIILAEKNLFIEEYLKTIRNEKNKQLVKKIK